MSNKVKFKTEADGQVVHLKNGQVAGKFTGGKFFHSPYGSSAGVKRWVNEYVAEQGGHAESKSPPPPPAPPINNVPVLSDAQIMEQARQRGLIVAPPPEVRTDPSLPVKLPEVYPMGEHGNSANPGPEVPPMPAMSKRFGDKTPEVIEHIKQWFPEEYEVRYQIMPPAKVVRMVEVLNTETGKMEKKPQLKTMPISGRGIPGHAKPHERA